ncbi:MAG: transketolase [Actinobacteria bacterium]|nr:transketolase [Actinomycetota bacterium]
MAPSPVNTEILGWNDLDDQAISYARALAADAVQRAGNGHPGTAMALAPVAYLLFQHHLRHDPRDPKWIGRDRFILSCGHSSLTLYTQLFYSGYGLTLDDLKEFRKKDSATPGHPEYGHTAGVETTTGPLGQGIGNAVGMAMAARFERGLFDPKAAHNQSIFDHHIYVLASDGDLQEGISAEASSIAGLQKLSNLIVIYDDNKITIEGDIELSFTEDVSARYRSYHWNVIEVGTLPSGEVDLVSLNAAINQAKSQTIAPTLIRLKTVIAWPAPKLQGSSKSHGSALGVEEVAATKVALGLDPKEDFAMPAEVLAHARKVLDRAATLRNEWDQKFKNWRNENKEAAELSDRLASKELPKNWRSSLPEFSSDKEISTRKASGDVIQKLAAVLPEMWGGSADLAESNNTTIEGAKSFLPLSSSSADPYGRVIHFGIREHAMGAIMNGIALHGGTKPFGGTFLVFSDYMRPSVRLAALMKLPVTYIWSHDSIGLGEDGPTHQPVEHIAALRAIPGLDVIRPADANEVAQCWGQIIENARPAGLLLSRQNLPVFDRSKSNSAAGATKGAYILREPLSGEKPKAILIATGSEVSLALSAQDALAAKQIPVRVVSMPCWEWFRAQSSAYQESVLPKNLSARVSIEAGIAMGWTEFTGSSGKSISLEHFGASASAKELFAAFGFTVERVTAAVEEIL